NVPTEIADMEVVAFITNTHQEIPSGNRALPDFTGLIHANDANVRYIVELPSTCQNTVTPQVNIQNMGQNAITSLDIEYIINGDSHNYTWTGNLESLRNETIELPEVTYTIQGNNTVEVNVPNDDENGNNNASITFDEAVAGTGTVDMELNVDQYGTEVRWYVRNEAGTVLYNGGPYPNNNPQTIYETFNLDA